MRLTDTMTPHSIRAAGEIGGGPDGAAGQVYTDPHEEFGGPDHTHDMSPAEIGIMVGVIVVFGAVIGSLFFYRARKIKKRFADHEAARAEEGGESATRDSAEIIDDKGGKEGVEAPSGSFGSFRQLFGRWPGVKSGRFE